MKRFGFALAVGFLAVTAAPAQQPGTTTPQTGPAATTGSTVVGTGTIVQSDVITTAPARRGLFSRIRNRSNTSAPVITTIPTTGTTVPIPGANPTPSNIPTPMPGTAPAPRTGTTSGVTTGSGVVQASGTTVVTGEGVTTSSYTVPSTTTAQTRRGVVARIRARR